VLSNLTRSLKCQVGERSRATDLEGGQEKLRGPSIGEEQPETEENDELECEDPSPTDHQGDGAHSQGCAAAPCDGTRVRSRVHEPVLDVRTGGAKCNDLPKHRPPDAGFLPLSL
jgi:hypothetical protein